MYFEIYQSPALGTAGLLGMARQWRWRLKAANHQIVAQGESYVQRADCERAINLLKQTTVVTPVRMAPA